MRTLFFASAMLCTVACSSEAEPEAAAEPTKTEAAAPKKADEEAKPAAVAPEAADPAAKSEPAAACNCKAGKEGGTVWCNTCEMGYIAGEKTKDKPAVDEALKGS